MLLLAFAAGMYGYLFPGNINTMMMHLYQRERYLALAGTVALALVFEYLYCLFAIRFCQTLEGSPTSISILRITGCILSFGWGLWILFEKSKPLKTASKSLITRGLVSIVVHPQQIPFWLYIYALARNLGHIGSVSTFALSNTLGCLVSFTLYIRVGTFLVRTYNLNEILLQKIAGLVYIASGVVFLIAGLK